MRFPLAHCTSDMRGRYSPLAAIFAGGWKHMEREENFSELVGGIYDAALDPMLWPDAVSGAARFVGGPGGALLSKDAATKSGETRFDGFVDPQQRRIYFEQYVGLDPTMIG